MRYDIFKDPCYSPDQEVADRAILKRVALHGICDADDMAAVERDRARAIADIAAGQVDPDGLDGV